LKVSLVIPYIIENEQQSKIVTRCIDVAAAGATKEDTEIVLIDNGSPISLTFTAHQRISKIKYNAENVGVVQTFKQGYEAADGDLICFIHSDVLLHEIGWDTRIAATFSGNDRLGLAGLFGAKILHPNGGRELCMSNMLGKEWGKCGCHQQSALHHGMLEQGVRPVSMFDGVGLFFRREALRQLVEETDFCADWRAPHHFYDRIVGCKIAIDLGWHMAVIGIGFDHWSGATGNASNIYAETSRKWLEKNGHAIIEGQPMDLHIYNIAEQQFFKEYTHRLPLLVDESYNYTWKN